MSAAPTIAATGEVLDYLDGLPFEEREREDARIAEAIRASVVAHPNPAAQERVSPPPRWRPFPTDG